MTVINFLSVGNTPLHLSVMLDRKGITELGSFPCYIQSCTHIVVLSDIVDFLLEHKASVKEKNNLGWTSLNEAVSRGDRELS